MSIQENKEIARRYFSSNANQIKQSIDNEGDDFHSKEFIMHGTRSDINLKEYLISMEAAISAFPDLKYNVKDIIGEGDQVVCRYIVTGTHQGNFMGIPTTGKESNVSGIMIYKLAGGKFEEAWGISDDLGLMQQLGVIPSQ